MDLKTLAKKPSGLYSATVDGKDAVIAVDEGKGFTIRTQSKPGWQEVKEYDSDGDLVAVYYDRVPKD